MTTDIWEEYRNQSDQTICIVGVLILSAKLCTVDGKKLSLYEKDAILNEFKTTDSKEREAILDILDKASIDKNSIEYHAERIKKFVDPTHKNFLKFVVATLVKFAKSDHHYSDEEQKIISKVAGVFELNKEKKSIFERLKKIKLN